MNTLTFRRYYFFAYSSPNIPFSNKHSNRNVPRYYLQFDTIVYANFVPPFATLPPAKSCDKVYPTRSQQYRYDVKIDKKKRGGGEGENKKEGGKKKRNKISTPEISINFYRIHPLRASTAKASVQTKQVVSIRQPGGRRPPPPPPPIAT